MMDEPESESGSVPSNSAGAATSDAGTAADPSASSAFGESIIDPEASSPKKRRRKSNRTYPPSTFDDAIMFARSVYDFGAGAPVRKLSYYNHIGKSPESSASRDSITNAFKYGLVKSSFASEQIELTSSALIIVGDNANERERAKAKISLGIENIEPFKIIYNRFVGNRMPAKSALTDAICEIGVPEELSDEAIDIFIVNLRTVGLLQVLSGAERILTIDHLLDSLPATPLVHKSHADVNNPPPAIGPASLPARSSETVNFDDVCFYIAPIGEAGSDTRKHSDLFLGSIVEPAITQLGLRVVRADTIGDPGMITRQIMEYILRSRLVVADLSFHNPNVFYELAIRHATRMPIVQIIRKANKIPFDVNQMRTIEIDDADIYTFVPNIEIYRADVATHARRALESTTEMETPVSVYFPALRTTIN
ncbi:hypothetical protein AncyloWKF20_16320 [Ancylobacter sp. WKF20]|uniref:hypothetical protein n=1 Tax=Ancylobacter sp. WKF20 TaxID=3039801 RepID=UPI0024343048|nr:hypothetical protein [Ancylobacter sp. WKF20]WGD29325.1 hypothetical protein AncyloWKF20_16320 [Ancylobacter sp. WKF20]